MRRAGRLRNGEAGEAPAGDAPDGSGSISALIAELEGRTDERAGFHGNLIGARARAVGALEKTPAEDVTARQVEPGVLVQEHLHAGRDAVFVHVEALVQFGPVCQEVVLILKI